MKDVHFSAQIIWKLLKLFETLQYILLSLHLQGALQLCGLNKKTFVTKSYNIDVLPR